MSYDLKSYILRKNKHFYSLFSTFKITPKTFKDIKTRNSFRENKYIKK
ncbi:flavodoxin [Clostridium botulinum]|nr:flavodoxin [Clostridium botulinum]